MWRVGETAAGRAPSARLGREVSAMPASLLQGSWAALLPFLAIAAAGLLVLLLDPMTAPERQGRKRFPAGATASC